MTGSDTQGEQFAAALRRVSSALWGAHFTASSSASSAYRREVRDGCATARSEFCRAAALYARTTDGQAALRNLLAGRSATLFLSEIPGDLTIRRAIESTLEAAEHAR